MKLKLASPEQVAMVYERDLKPSFPQIGRASCRERV